MNLELNLLHELKIIASDQLAGCMQLLKAKEDDKYLLEASIKNLRKERIKKYGHYIKDNVGYKNINYDVDIFNEFVALTAFVSK